MDEKQLKKTKEVKIEKDDAAERPKLNRTTIKCPYCDTESEQKIKFSFAGSVPNLIECDECHYHFIVMQTVEIKTAIVEIQNELEKATKNEEETKSTKGSKSSKAEKAEKAAFEASIAGNAGTRDAQF